MPDCAVQDLLLQAMQPLRVRRLLWNNLCSQARPAMPDNAGPRRPPVAAGALPLAPAESSWPWRIAIVSSPVPAPSR